MLRRLLIICLSGLAWGCWGAACGADVPHVRHPGATGNARVALVIGNGAYPQRPLGNAGRDAEAITAALHARGYQVHRYRDLDRRGMLKALRDFRAQLPATGSVLFYFAGHGAQIGSDALLLPVDADAGAPARLRTTSIELRALMQTLTSPRPGRQALLVVDACLDNPFAPAAAPAALPRPPPNMLLAYATTPGGHAADGRRHGIYTAALLDALAAPADASAANVGQQLAQAARAVAHATAGKQQAVLLPSLRHARWRLPAVVGDAPPAPAAEQVVALDSRGVLPKDSAEQYELAFWDSIKDSKNAADYEAYLQTYPNGRFAALARARVAEYKHAAPKAAAPKSEAAPPPAAAPAPSYRESKPAAQSKPAPAAPSREASASAPASGRSELRDCSDCPELVSLPAGSFTMGSNSSDPSEKPAHRVTIRAPFAIGKYEVTMEQWQACVHAGACSPLPSDAGQAPKEPARDLSWDDAQQYLKWLAKKTGKHYRLPTEAEWEYAARAGTTGRYWWGDKMVKGKADCKDCGDPWQQGAPTPVGSFAPNAWGLYDMSGSVWEWVSDCWHNSFKGAPSAGHSWDDANCRVRVIRGGSWREDASYMPVTTRFKYDASVRFSQNGFRVARDLE